MKAVVGRALILVVLGTIGGQSKSGAAEAQVSWLDESKPASWNAVGRAIPTAPRVGGQPDPRCRQRARPPELVEDRAVRERGWELDGDYQGGWQIVVIRGTAGWDGMCRPRQYQAFVFLRGAFAGTLSPTAMDSRTDGALTRVFLSSDSRLTAEYLRYTASDPACCPSRTTTVTFEIVAEGPVLSPASASTFRTR